MGVKLLPFQADLQVALQHLKEKTPARIQQVAVNRGEPAKRVLEEAALRADMLGADGDFQLIVVTVIADLRRKAWIEVEIRFEIIFKNTIESACFGGGAWLQ